MGTYSGISAGRGPSSTASRLNHNLEMLAFWEEGKPKNTTKKPSEQE